LYASTLSNVTRVGVGSASVGCIPFAQARSRGRLSVG
jgi:hypothetical protein